MKTWPGWADSCTRPNRRRDQPRKCGSAVVAPDAVAAGRPARRNAVGGSDGGVRGAARREPCGRVFPSGIVYLADAVGTQTETLAIRGLSVGVGIRRIIGREALTGLSVGVLLGVTMLPVVALMTGDWMLGGRGCLRGAGGEHDRHGGGVGAALAAASPRKDPAFGSGPLATVIQDLLSIVIYLLAVTVLLT